MFIKGKFPYTINSEFKVELHKEIKPSVSNSGDSVTVVIPLYCNW